jgi:hypothetical protein
MDREKISALGSDETEPREQMLSGFRMRVTGRGPLDRAARWNLYEVDCVAIINTFLRCAGSCVEIVHSIPIGVVYE